MAHLMESKTRTLLVAVFALAFLAIACRDFEDRAGSSGLTPPATITAEGIWEGEYTTLVGVGDSGSVTFVVDEDEAGILSGCSCWTGAACWNDGLFSGSITDGKFDSATVMRVLGDPFVMPNDPNQKPTINVLAQLSIIADFLSGTFEVPPIQDLLNRFRLHCSDGITHAGDSGTLSLVRTARKVDAAAVCQELRNATNYPRCEDFPLPRD